MKTITLESEKSIVIQQELATSVDEIQLKELIDNLNSVKAVIIFGFLEKVYTLWEGESYKEIGDWTQAQAEARLVEVLA